MAYKIDPSACLGCGTCEGECPAGAISQNGDVYQIDPEKCADCGTCADACPASAISQE
ncbi:MAG: 4Fe-4S binding protein [Sphaerochaetaceae bacterium]